MIHWHYETNYMQGGGLGTFPDKPTTQDCINAERGFKSRGYDAQQLAGGVRAYQCDCPAGALILTIS